MKRTSLLLAALCLTLSLAIYSCKKNADSAPVDYTAELSAQADDQSQVSGEVEYVTNDANLAMATMPSLNGKEALGFQPICDATITADTLNGRRSVIITYNGSTCNGNRTRTGTVTLSLPTGVRWKDAGAQMTVLYKDLKIVRVADNKTATINGTKVITNVSGGLLTDLPGKTITHTITSSGITISFDNGTQRTWQIARQRVYTYSNGFVATITGLHTEGNVSNIAEWGTNRLGNSFTSAITQPLVIRQDCNFRLTSGTISHTRGAASATAVFGLDSAGNPTTCPAGNYYYKLSWTGIGGAIKTIILPY
jgi:hypothetical protein